MAKLGPNSHYAALREEIEEPVPIASLDDKIGSGWIHHGFIGPIDSSCFALNKFCCYSSNQAAGGTPD